MPIEVRELVIRARVEETPQATDNPGVNPPHTQGLSDRDLQKIVALCTEQIMKVLNRKNER